jgi:hypothetical protein
MLGGRRCWEENGRNELMGRKDCRRIEMVGRGMNVTRNGMVGRDREGKRNEKEGKGMDGRRKEMEERYMDARRKKKIGET